MKAGTLEKLVEHLVPAFQGSDLSYVTVFLCRAVGLGPSRSHDNRTRHLSDV